jgi:hypothetical protein
MASDSHSDMSRDTVSLTYEELAERLGIDTQSARRRALRSHWLRTKGNDGRARVSVPATVLPNVGATNATPLPVVLTTNLPPAALVAATPESLSHLLSQVAEVGELRERLGRMEAERDTARGEAAAERTRAERGEAERETARIATARAEGEAAALRDSVAREVEARRAAEAEREATRQALAEWEAGGPLARAWRAFLYRRRP